MSAPGLQVPMVLAADRDARRAQAGAERVDHDRDVHVLVGVDADTGDDLGGGRGFVHDKASGPVATA